MLTVVDLSAKALARARHRLGHAANRISWIEGDITSVDLPPDHFDVWHDRAVFHFLIDAGARRKYVERAGRSVRRGGAAIIATFGPQGPPHCSGLDVTRYSADELATACAADFDLERGFVDSHQTPSGAQQQFTFAVLRRKRAPSVPR